jgi:transcriptional regulator with XRE-family HTH domain
MSTAERGYQRASRRAERILASLAEEIRTARLMSGASQQAVALAARTSTSKLSRLEAAKLASLSIVDAVLLADAVGLDFSFKAYPGRRPTRDAAHARKLTGFLSYVGKPLRYGLEVLLPPRDGVPEQRAWDAMIFGADGETGVELEMRLYDIQAQTRRIFMKWRDSGAERLLLLINDTSANRRVLRTYPDYFKDLPRLKTAAVLATLANGERPETGYLLV